MRVPTPHSQAKLVVRQAVTHASHRTYSGLLRSEATQIGCVAVYATVAVRGRCHHEFGRSNR